MSKAVLIGEPMALFIAKSGGRLSDVEEFTRAVAGAELNVAVGLRRLGHEVTYITKLGRDPFGTHIRDFLEEEKIDTSMVRWDDGHPTGFQLKGKALDPEVCYFRRGSAASHTGPGDLAGFDLKRYDHLHLTGIFPALSPSALELTRSLARTARESGIPVTFDPNLRPALWPDRQTMVEVINGLAALCDVILPGAGEGEVLVGTRDEKKIADFYLSRGAKAVAVKLGPDGAYLKTAEAESYLPPFCEDRKVDTVGAGDGFAAGVISGLLEGLSHEKAVERGNAVGTMQIMSPYDNRDLPDRETLFSFMETHAPKARQSYRKTEK